MSVARIRQKHCRPLIWPVEYAATKPERRKRKRKRDRGKRVRVWDNVPGPFFLPVRTSWDREDVLGPSRILLYYSIV